MHARRMIQSLRTAMQDTPVVVVNGARQVGKSTLLRALASDPASVPGGMRYYTLDDAATFAAASSDPSGFIAGNSKGRTRSANGIQPAGIVIDEVQRVPALMLAIKHAVDELRIAGLPAAGRFLLSGSANVLLLPRLADSLAGRMEVLTLWPLAQAELESAPADPLQHGPNTLIDALFAPDLGALLNLKLAQSSTEELAQRMLAGGYPEALQRASESRRDAWFAAYLQSVLQRDVRELAQIDGLTQLPMLLAQLAHKATGMLNIADVSRTLGLPQTTLKRYLTLLQTVYLIGMLPAWAPRESQRAQKTPKLFFNDSGLHAHLLGLGNTALKRLPGLHGPLLETFAFAELQKLCGWAKTPAQLMHYRTSTGMEVDFVLQDRQQRIVGIEVKASMHLGTDAFKGLRHLREIAGDRFHRGIVLHPGAQAVPFDRQLCAMPLTALWA